MNSEWRIFLEEHGAVFTEFGTAHFGDPIDPLRAAADGDLIADLSHLGLIRASGDDTRDFLMGQLTNDVRLVTEDRSQLNGYCNPKGRLLALFRVFRHDGDFFLQCPRPLVGAIIGRLRMFVLRSKVRLEDVSDQWVCFGIAGTRCSGILAGQELQLPAQPDLCTAHGSVRVARLPDPGPRSLVIAPVDHGKALWTALTAGGCRRGGQPAWELLSVRAGIPEIWPDTAEEYVPQMINLHWIGGVSFKKGCYPGQEIVARTHYLGKLKRRLYRARSDDGNINRNAPVFDAESRQVGQVLLSATTADGGSELLAVLEIAAAATPLRAVTPEGSPLALQELPYPVDNGTRG